MMEAAPNSKSLFNYYNTYKVILGILLFTLVLTEHPYLRQFRLLAYFELLSLAYLLLNAGLLILYRFYLRTSPRQIFSWLILDIIFLHMLFYFGTGIAEGLGNLIIISVAAGNILMRGRIGLSFAALAAILSMFIEIERYLSALGSANDIAQSGLIGIMYFASALILQNLSKRISQSETLLKQQEQDLLELEKLNHQIIQSMRTGILVCSFSNKIKLINESCKDLLNLEPLQALPAALSERLEQWRSAPQTRTTPFRVASGLPLVQANFSRLQKKPDSDVLIFIEDTRRMTQQAQQLKLASLGRLTASIAHEVRNPLGAISHATQLLAESEHLDQADKKMTDIIQRHSKRVNQIIENTLQLSRRSEPAIQDVDLLPWLQKLVADYSHFQSRDGEDQTQSNVVICCANPAISARFDPSQIEQVIVNMVDNGLRHGMKKSSGAKVFIFLAETKDNNQAYIDIIDQGDGISHENSQHLFEPFFTTESQGTGLGLYLSRELCEANQAQLEYLDPTQDTINWHSPPYSDLFRPSPDMSPGLLSGACFRIMFAHHKRIL
jgi:two-component system sensor histidine kinase PilS (NtrC family)